MHSLSAVLGVVPILLALGTPPQDACTDAVQSRWLQGCMAAVSSIERAGGGPADGQSDQVFLAESDLAGSFVKKCEQLLASPEKIPAAARQDAAKSGWPPAQDGCSAAERVKWLDACVQDARAIVPGSRRSDVLKHFDEEGGLSTVVRRSYLHHRCSMLKIDVTFRLGRGPGESTDDVVRSVSAYIGFATWD